MELGLRGKLALVTAASRGLGRSITESLLADDCWVCVTSSSEPCIAAAAREMAKAGREVHALAADLGRYDECDRFFAWAISTLGGLPRCPPPVSAVGLRRVGGSCLALRERTYEVSEFPVESVLFFPEREVACVVVPRRAEAESQMSSTCWAMDGSTIASERP